MHDEVRPYPAVDQGSGAGNPFDIEREQFGEIYVVERHQSERVHEHEEHEGAGWDELHGSDVVARLLEIEEEALGEEAQGTAHAGHDQQRLAAELVDDRR